MRDSLFFDWRAVEDWLSRLPSVEARSAIKADCQRAWLLHLRDALGGAYELHESAQCFVLSPYTDRFAAATLDFVARTRERVAATLAGLAQEQSADKEILIVFTDPNAYYRYISHAYPDDGEFSFSSGMFLHAGCPHFVTVHDEMHTVERVIAHEMTHASLAHLRIPLWLNEGIAVNTEDRLMGRLPKLFTPAEMREKHLASGAKRRFRSSGPASHFTVLTTLACFPMTSRRYSLRSSRQTGCAFAPSFRSLTIKIRATQRRAST